MQKYSPNRTALPRCAMLAALSGALLIGLPAYAHEYSPLFKAKKYAEIERAITAKLTADPNNADALIAKAELIITEGKEERLDEGSKFAEQCIAAHPQRSECFEALGNVLGTKAQIGGIVSAMGYAGKIRDAFIKAVELDPKNYQARSSLLQYYLQAPGFVGGGKGKAQSLVVETNKVSPAAGALLQATIDLSDEKFARAEAAALAVIVDGNEVLSDMQRGVLSNLGHAYIKEKKYMDAERLFRELNQRFPESSAGNYGFGKLLQEQGKFKEAVMYFDKAIATEASAYAYFRLGQCQRGLNDKAKAIAAFEKALASRPELRKKQKAEAEDQLKALRAL